MDSLNERERFHSWPSENGLPLDTDVRIWALFDPVKEEPASTAIYLTDHGQENVELLSHEVAHYWFDRFCFYEQWTRGTEAFAVEFIEDYQARLGGGGVPRHPHVGTAW